MGILEMSRQKLFILSVFLVCSLKSTRNYCQDLKVETQTEIMNHILPV